MTVELLVKNTAQHHKHWLVVKLKEVIFYFGDECAPDNFRYKNEGEVHERVPFFSHQWVQVKPVDLQHALVELLANLSHELRGKPNMVLQPPPSDEPKCVDAKYLHSRPIA